MEEIDKGNRKIQYLSTFCVAISSLCLGAISTWPSPVLPKFSNNETKVVITEHEIAWLIAMNPPGFILGSLISGYTADDMGRRGSLLLSVLPMVIGSAITVFAVRPWLLFVARFLWGCGTGIVGTIVTMYIGEIADKDIRGSLMTITKVLFNFGSLVMMALGPFVSYKVINLFLLLLPLCYFLSCWLIPESPYFYLKDGRKNSARKVLKEFRGYVDLSVLETELSTLESHVRNDMQRSTSPRELFTGPAYRKAIIVAIVLKTVQIMMGAATITHYLAVIMQESGAGISLKTVLIVFGTIRFVVGLMSTVLVDRVGRRPLLFYSCIGYGVSLTIVALYFILKDVIEVDLETLRVFGFVPFIGIILSSIVSTLGIVTIIFIIPGEIFPTNIKAVALSSLNIYGGILGFIVAHTYQALKDVAGLTGVFLVFATVTYFGAVFVYFYLPETKGKSLHEILQEIQGPHYKEIEVTNSLLKANDRSDIDRNVVNGNTTLCTKL